MPFTDSSASSRSIRFANSTLSCAPSVFTGPGLSNTMSATPSPKSSCRIMLLFSQTRSISVATPMPSPTQSVATPRFAPVRSSSSTSVPIMILPVAPIG